MHSRGRRGKYVTYIDDLVCFSKTFDEHLERLGLIFDRLSRVNLKLKATKCLLMQRKITFL